LDFIKIGCRGYRLDSSGSGLTLVGSCEHGNEPQTSVKYSEQLFTSQEGLCCMELVHSSVSTIAKDFLPRTSWHPFCVMPNSTTVVLLPSVYFASNKHPPHYLIVDICMSSTFIPNYLFQIDVLLEDCCSSEHDSDISLLTTSSGTGIDSLSIVNLTAFITCS
jgi:hypothetical protein